MGIIESPHPAPVQPSVLVMKQSLINCRQHEAFLKVLMVSCSSCMLYYDSQYDYIFVQCLQRDILLCAEHLDQLEQNFKSQMNNLRETVQAKTAVPTAQVYVS